MKLLRYEHAGVCGSGVLEGDTVAALTGEIWENGQPTGERFSLDQVNVLAPIENPPDIFAIGLNYRAHADEQGAKYPASPVVFLKASSSILGPRDPIVLPEQAPSEVDYEGELVLVIGKTCSKVSEEDALDYVLGCTCGNDVSARDAQLRLDVQWARGKSFDSFCPIGPFIETDLDPDNLQVISILNGNTMQEGNTSDMIFSCAKIVSYISNIATMKPGTIIMTGTPSGVGFSRKPPVFLKNKDIIEVEIQGIGKLTNPVTSR